MALFNIGKQSIPTPKEEYDKMLGIEKYGNKGNIIEINIDLLDEIVEQKFKIHNDNISALVESINKVGVLDPIIVRSKKNGHYDIISGRHRTRACKILKLETVPCIIRDCSVDEARYILLSTNLNRNNELAPSELAYGYKEQTDLLKKLSNTNPSVAQVANENSMNKRTIQRYIRLTYLIRQLLNLVDNKTMSLTAGVELSYLSEDNQQRLFTYILNADIQISKDQAAEIRNLVLMDKDTPLLLNDNILYNVFYPEKTENYSGEVRHDVAPKEIITENISTVKTLPQEPPITPPSEATPLPATEDAKINTPKAEKEKALAYNKSTDINAIKLSGTAAIQAIKEHFGNETVYSYYAFNVPTQGQAKNYLANTFNCGDSGSVIITHQGVDCKITLDDVDKYIRQLIENESLIAKSAILDAITKKYKELTINEGN